MNKMEQPKVFMVASDQPKDEPRQMTVDQAQKTLDYEKKHGLNLWSVSPEDKNYTLSDNGKIITRNGPPKN